MTGITPACDIWSLGCTIIELLTGNPPYFALSPPSALYHIVSDPHPPLPEGISSVRTPALSPSLALSLSQVDKRSWTCRHCETF